MRSGRSRGNLSCTSWSRVPGSSSCFSGDDRRSPVRSGSSSAPGRSSTWPSSSPGRASDPRTPSELKGLIDDHVREEIASREARRLGLDRDDTLIRRRLRQKLEFLVEDDAQSAPPTDAELQAWLDAHREAYRRDPDVGFRHVLVSRARARPGRRGGCAGAAGPPDRARPSSRHHGHGRPLANDPGRDRDNVPARYRGAVRRAIRQCRGRPAAAPLGGPGGIRLRVASRSRHAAHRWRLPALSEVRDDVVRDLLGARRAERLETMYRRLSERHPVVVEMPGPTVAARAARERTEKGTP